MFEGTTLVAIRMELWLILINMTPDNCIYTAEVVPYTDIHPPFIVSWKKSKHL